MPGVGEVTVPLKFTGGLNLTTPPTEIADDELVTCDNFWFPRGVMTKRAGFHKATTTPLSSSKLVILGFNPLDGRFLIAPQTGTLLWRTLGGSQPTAVLPSTGSITNIPKWLQVIQDVAYVGFDGAMGIRTLTAGVLSDAAITNSPPSTTHAWHKNRIFTNVYGVTGRIMWSDAPGLVISGTLTWTSTNTWDVGVEDKEPITALVSLGDLLIIFKLTSTWVLYVQGDSPANWVLRKLNNSIGCAETRGSLPWHSYSGEIYFISQQGLYKTNGQSFVNLSEKIWKPGELSFTYGSSNNTMRVTRWYDTLIITYSYSPSITLGSTYTYNLRTRAWSRWTFLGSDHGFDDIFANYSPISIIATSVIATNGANVYYTNDNYVPNYDAYLALDYNTYADGILVNQTGTGTAYTATFQSKEFTTDLDKFLRLKWLGLEYISRGSPSFSIVSDGVAGSSVAPGYHATLRKGYKMAGSGRRRSVALKCTHALTSPFEFYRATMHLTGKVPLLTSGTP
jgi:hypothetical protein